MVTYFSYHKIEALFTFPGYLIKAYLLFANLL